MIFQKLFFWAESRGNKPQVCGEIFIQVKICLHKKDCDCTGHWLLYDCLLNWYLVDLESPLEQFEKLEAEVLQLGLVLEL